MPETLQPGGPDCERCGEEPALVKVSVTTLDGVVLSHEAVCRMCADGVGENNLRAAEDLARAQRGTIEVDQSNVFTCTSCGHVYSDKRPCPECGASS